MKNCSTQESNCCPSRPCSMGPRRLIIIIIVRLATFQCVAPLAADNLQSGLSSASSVASSTPRLWYDRWFFIVCGRPVGRFQSLGGTAERILLASAVSSSFIFAALLWGPKIMALIFSTKNFAEQFSCGRALRRVN